MKGNEEFHFEIRKSRLKEVVLVPRSQSPQVMPTLVQSAGLVAELSAGEARLPGDTA